MTTLHTQEDPRCPQTPPVQNAQRYCVPKATCHPLERERVAKHGQLNPVVTSLPYDAYIHSGVLEYKWHCESHTD
jgi:hypothetical protein